MQTECLVAASADTSIDIYLRFLQLLLHRTAQPVNASGHSETELETKKTNERSLARHLAGEPWEEGIEREVSVLNLSLRSLLYQSRLLEIEFPGECLSEESTDDSAATIIREQKLLSGTVIIAAESVGTDIFRIRIHIENRTPGTDILTSNAVMAHSFVSTHSILQVHQGTFISLLDPPEELKIIAKECHNLHTWPVLIGNEGDHDTMLSSPIILYDYPQIAPESPGALFDGTEIDELLTLRIMTLTDEEKEEMRQSGERAREILERTESLSPEQLMKLHGVIRSLRPVDQGSKHE
jgi:hydrogenase maturation protease